MDGSKSGDRNVNFGQALGLGLKNFFRFTGRSSRGAFWWWVVWMALYTFLSFSIESAFGNRIVGGAVEVLVEAGFPLPDDSTTVSADAAQGTPTTAQGSTATAPDGTAGSTTTAAQDSSQTSTQTGAADEANSAAQSIPEASPVYLAIPAVFLLVGIILFIPTLTLKIRRLHDAGFSGWWIFLNLIPVAGFVVLLLFYARAPSAGENPYGPSVEAGRD